MSSIIKNSRCNQKNQLYIIQRILERRKSQTDEFQYLIKWKNYSSKHNTWQPVSNLETAPLLVQAFNESCQKAQNQKKSNKFTYHFKNIDIQEKIEEEINNCQQENAKINYQSKSQEFLSNSNSFDKNRLHAGLYENFNMLIYDNIKEECIPISPIREQESQLIFSCKDCNQECVSNLQQPEFMFHSKKNQQQQFISASVSEKLNQNLDIQDQNSCQQMKKNKYRNSLCTTSDIKLEPSKINYDSRKNIHNKISSGYGTVFEYKIDLDQVSQGKQSDSDYKLPDYYKKAYEILKDEQHNVNQSLQQILKNRKKSKKNKKKNQPKQYFIIQQVHRNPPLNTFLVENNKQDFNERQTFSIDSSINDRQKLIKIQQQQRKRSRYKKRSKRRIYIDEDKQKINKNVKIQCTPQRPKRQMNKRQIFQTPIIHIKELAQPLSIKQQFKNFQHNRICQITVQNEKICFFVENEDKRPASIQYDEVKKLNSKWLKQYFESFI